MDTRSSKDAVRKTISGVSKSAKDTSSRKIVTEVLDAIVDAAVANTSANADVITPSVGRPLTSSTEAEMPSIEADDTISENQASADGAGNIQSTQPLLGAANLMDCEEGNDDVVDGYVDDQEFRELHQPIDDQQSNSSAPIAMTITPSVASQPIVLSTATTSTLSNVNGTLPAVVTVSHARQQLFDRNADLSLPAKRFRANAIIVDAEINNQVGNNAPLIDVRQSSMRRLQEYKLRLASQPQNRISLEMMQEQVTNHAERIIRSIEKMEDSRILSNEELLANQNNWETITL